MFRHKPAPRHRALSCCALLFAFEFASGAAELLTLPEHLRPDPFGEVVQADRTPGLAPAKNILLEGARTAFVSCHLIVKIPRQGAYRLQVIPFAASSGLRAELYREWYHYLPNTGKYYPDALVPVAETVQSKLPEPDNRIDAQTAQGYWLDVWIGAKTAPGVYRTKAVLDADGRRSTASIEVRVLAAAVPEEDAVVMDHNSYGTSWLAADYPALRSRAGGEFYASDRFFELIHAYYRIFYEHRGAFHQLGYAGLPVPGA